MYLILALTLHTWKLFSESYIVNFTSCRSESKLLVTELAAPVCAQLVF